MKLTFLYTPVTELKPALAFYRDTLGWSETWREGDDTVAFAIPDSEVQVMVSVRERADDAPGAMYQVPNLAEFMAEHPDLVVRYEEREIPGGHVVGVEDPAGNVLYLFDQTVA